MKAFGVQIAYCKKPQTMPTPAVVYRSITTPLGDMLLAGGDAGLRGAWFDGQSHHPTAVVMADWCAGDHPNLDMAQAALMAYWKASSPPTALTLDWAQGTAFQRSVWQALCQVPLGQSVSYSELAQRVGKPAAVRAVGAAVGRNPWSVLVPCHRVLGANGALTGYAGGLPRKVALLNWEQKR
jgi:methylated-DNA-[protein]-cysteine S-methyltransferase